MQLSALTDAFPLDTNASNVQSTTRFDTNNTANSKVLTYNLIAGPNVKKFLWMSRYRVVNISNMKNANIYKGSFTIYVMPNLPFLRLPSLSGKGA